jgi:hypothetical protein
MGGLMGTKTRRDSWAVQSLGRAPRSAPKMLAAVEPAGLGGVREEIRKLASTFLVCLLAAAATLTALAGASEPAGASPSSTTWSQQSPSSSPPARDGAAMAYDASTGNTVLFGGDPDNTEASVLADTWTWDGTTWTQQFPASSPPARVYASMAYDPSTGNVVLFGGFDGAQQLADTWTWDGTTWAEQLPAGSPTARSDASMAYDSTTGNMVLFGGGNKSTGDLSDTWTWDGTTWTQQTPATHPSARVLASMADDPATGNMVLFGGNSGPYLADTWTWDGTNWTGQSPATSPPHRFGADMAYDTATGNLVLFGGSNGDSGGTFFSDTWGWDGTTWTQQAPSTSPPSRTYATMAYDSANDSMVLFGGATAFFGGSNLSDTWTYVNIPVITSFSPTSGPVGTAVTLKGVNLSGATKVTLNGVTATITKDASNKIKIKVPAGATTGKFKGSTPLGKAKSATAFRVT